MIFFSILITSLFDILRRNSAVFTHGNEWVKQITKQTTESFCENSSFQLIMSKLFFFILCNLKNLMIFLE